MKLVIVNDPVPFILQATQELYPDINFKAQYNEDLPVKGKSRVYGSTFFPDDGGIPTIDINAKIPIRRVPEILAHEIAHVVAGKDAEHGDKWAEIFDQIYNMALEKYFVVMKIVAIEEREANAKG